MDIDLIKQLAELASVAGREKMQADLIRRLVSPFADETRTDRLGSVIAHEKSRSGKGPRVVFEAPMSSPGYLANDFRESGLVCLSPLGRVDRTASLYSRIVFSGGAKGVIVPDSENDGAVAADVGALTADEAGQTVRAGEWAVYEPSVTEIAGDYLLGWPLSQASACAALIEIAKKLDDPECDVWFVFSSRRMTNGSRGTGAALFGLEEEGAVDYAVEIGCAAEIRDVKRTGGGSAVAGKGACVKLKDGRSVCDPDLARVMRELASEAGIPYQLYVGSDNMSDTLAMQTSGLGTVAGGIVIPVRNINTPSEMLSRADVESASKLAAALVKALGKKA